MTASRRAPLDAFLENPRGRHVAGRTWLYWCHPTGRFFGFTLWGRPNEGEMAALVRALHVELTDALPPHASLVDARRVEGVDLGAFTVLQRYVKERGPQMVGRVTRLAICRPSGLAGASVAGFYQVLAPPYPLELFESASEAARWLGFPPSVLPEVEALVAEASGVDPLVGELRTLLEARGPRLAVGAAARALALSQRTLQRRLATAGTTYQREAAAVRLAAAQKRMLDSDAPLTQVALDSGFPSLQTFSAQFKAHTGLTPSEWRARARR